MRKQLFIPLVVLCGLLYTCNKKNNPLGVNADISNVCLSEGASGDTLTIGGTGFSNANQLSGTLNSTPITILSASSTELVATVPAGTPTGGTITIVSDGKSSTYPYDLSITGVAIAPGKSGGLVVTITGAGFAGSASGNTLTIGGVSFSITSATSTQIVASTTSSSASSVLGAFSVGAQQQCIDFGFNLAIDSVLPNKGQAGTQVTLKGQGFSTTVGNDVVKFNGTAAAVKSATDSILVVTAPAGGTSGPVSVTVGGNTYSNLSFSYGSLVPVTITTISPNTGSVGTSVTITGTGFDTAKVNDLVNFDGISAAVTSATATQLVVTVPANAETGAVGVAVDGGTAVIGPVFTVVTGSTVYVGGADGYIYAIDGASGTLKWKVNVGAGYGVITPPILYNGSVYANSVGYFYKLNAATGATIWSTAFSTQSFSGVGGQTAVIAGGVEVVSGSYIFALDTASGNVLWNTMNYHAGDSARNQIGVGANGQLYSLGVNSSSQFYPNYLLEVMQVDPVSGNEIWNAEHNAPAWPGVAFSDPVYDNGTVFVASDTLEAFNASTGALQWKFRMGYPGYQNLSSAGDPVGANGIVYVSNGDTLFAVNEATGALQWLNPSIYGSTPTVSGGVVFMGVNHGMVAMDAVTGSQLWSISTNGNTVENFVYGPGTVAGGNLYTFNTVLVTAFNASTGKQVWQYAIGGYIVGGTAQ
jgi:outer membrane protein assembly factor BamB